MATLLLGTRVNLRPIEKTDLPQFTRWFQTYELLRNMVPVAIRPMNTDGEEAWYRSVQADKHNWTFAVDALDDPAAPDGRLIGSTGLMGVDGKNRRAVFGISIGDPAMRGRGYGGEAIDLVLEWGFLELNLNRIQLHVFEFNEGARRLYERKGFKTEGVIRQGIYREGRYWDEHVMGILRAEWTPARAFGAEAPRS